MIHDGATDWHQARIHVRQERSIRKALSIGSVIYFGYIIIMLLAAHATHVPLLRWATEWMGKSLVNVRIRAEGLLGCIDVGQIAQSDVPRM